MTAVRARRLLRALAAGWVLYAAPAAAQEARAEPRELRGRVLTPVDSGEPRPVPGVWVTLHRIGYDTAGAVDSVRTARDGRYAFRVRIADDDSASWIASTQHAGIAHFSAELSSPAATAESGEIVVFDTTGAPVTMHVQGRHLVVFAAPPGTPHEVMEVYEISNDSTVTAVSRGDASPVWSAPLPRAATDVRLGEGDLAAGAVRLDGGRVRVYAPITPGLRQISFRYRLPAGAFPLEIPLREEAQVLEVLVEDPLARVAAPGLVEHARTEVEGHHFRRFLARHVERGTVVRVEVPTRAAARRAPAVALVASFAAVAMCAAFLLGLRRPPDGAAEGALSAT